MANMFFNSNIVYWKIYINDADISENLSRYVKSITVKNAIAPRVKHSKDKFKMSPNTAEITVVSENYVENLFLEGSTVSIWFGYTPVQLTCVFRGIIPSLPEGEAHELLSYTIRAVGEDLVLALYWRNRTFTGSTKTEIIHELITDPMYNFDYYISIQDINPLKMKHRPVQREENDMEFLKRCADNWGCVWWTELGTPQNKFYFCDAESAHYFKYSTDYILGYKTDKVKNNVESVQWKHKAETGVVNEELQVTGFNESGEVTSPQQFSKMWVDKTSGRMAVWELNADLYLKATKGTAKERRNFSEIVKIIGQMKDNMQSYEALKRYYHIVSYTDGGTSDAPPSHANSGYDITVRLNEGDLALKPPRNAKLYAGSLNPRAVSSQLPNWLYRYSGPIPDSIKLKINETELSFSEGRLQTSLSCSMGMFS